MPGPGDASEPAEVQDDDALPLRGNADARRKKRAHHRCDDHCDGADPGECREERHGEADNEQRHGEQIDAEAVCLAGFHDLIGFRGLFAGFGVFAASYSNTHDASFRAIVVLGEFAEPFSHQLGDVVAYDAHLQALPDELVDERIRRLVGGFLVGDVGVVDEGAPAALGDDVAIAFDVPVHFSDRVVVDTDRDGKLAYRGDLIADFVVSGRDEVDQTVSQLQPDGDAALLVDLDGGL